MKRLVVLISTMGLMTMMLAAPSTAMADTTAGSSTDKVWVCKVVGGPGDYRLQTGDNPIHVSANVLDSDVNPVMGSPFSDAQPSFLIASDSRALCEAGLPLVVISREAASPGFVAGTCLAAGTVEAPATVAYSWTISGPDSAKVYTAVAKTGYALTGQTSWTFDLSQLESQSATPDDLCYLAPDEDEPVEVLGVGAVATPRNVPAAAAKPSLASTGVDGVVPLGIFGLIALALGAGLAAAAHRVARD